MVFRRVNLGQGADLSRDLSGEFPRGSEHQGSRLRAARLEKPVEQGQRKGRRLAGAGLSQAQHVAAGATRGNGLLLDRPGILETDAANAANQGLVEFEPVETGRRSRCGTGYQYFFSAVRAQADPVRQGRSFRPGQQ